MTYPTPYTVKVEFSRPGGPSGTERDSHGSLKRFYLPTEERKVIGWAAPESRDAAPASAANEVIEVQLYVPPAFLEGWKVEYPTGTWIPLTFPGGAGQQPTYVTLPAPDGQKYFVIGAAELAAGPGGWKPGAVINLKRSR